MRERSGCNPAINCFSNGALLTIDDEADVLMAEPANRKTVLAVCCGAHGVQDGLGAALCVLMPILAQTP